jgi:hypothetical protein
LNGFRAGSRRGAKSQEVRLLFFASLRGPSRSSREPRCFRTTRCRRTASWFARRARRAAKRREELQKKNYEWISCGQSARRQIPRGAVAVLREPSRPFAALRANRGTRRPLDAVRRHPARTPYSPIGVRRISMSRFCRSAGLMPGI